MVSLKTWPDIFESAVKWPELRIMSWKSLNREPEIKRAFMHMLRTITKPDELKVITLSADLVWAICKLSMELDPTFLFEQVTKVRLPFNRLLIDWDGQDRAKAYKEMRISQEVAEHPATERPAFLTTALSNGGMSINFISYESEDKTLCWFPMRAEVNLPVPGKTATLSNYMEKYYRDEKYTVADWMFTTNVLRRYPEAIALKDDQRVNICMTGPLAIEFTNRQGNFAQALMSGTAGQFRWFGALCALLNRQGVVRYVDAPAGPPDPGKPATGHAKPSSRSQVLTLMLPRDKVVRRVVRDAERERKKVGLHEVMGHWAYRHHAEADTCHHQWPNQPTRRQVCEVCGAVRWWKEPHKRGQGDVLKPRERRADFTGIAIDRLVKTIKEDAKT